MEEIIGHSFDDSTLEWNLTVHWKGFSTLEDTQETFTSMFEDVPKLVEEYVRNLAAKKHKDAEILKVLLGEINGNNIGSLKKRKQTEPIVEVNSKRKKAKSSRSRT